MKVAPFEIDITPPLGEALAYGVNRGLDSPIHVRGLVIDDGRTRAVLAAAEIIGLYAGAHQIWRKVLAHASRTPAKQVLLHSVHQHDSVRPASPNILALLRRFDDPRHPSTAYTQCTLERLAAGVRQAIRPGQWRTVTGIATAECRVQGLAANRRILGPDGKVRTTRWSMNADPRLWREPVGRIDPLLRSIGLYGPGGRLVASLHFYASHPMAAYAREQVGADVPGVALARLKKAVGGSALHLYFTGCAGDITFGKYTTPSKERSLKLLGKRLGNYLLSNVQAFESRALGPLALRHTPFEVPLDRQRLKLSTERARLERSKNYAEAAWLAVRYETLRRWKTLGRPVLSRLDLGPGVHILSLPAETAVAYQLYAQAQAPEHFLATAAYGDCSLQYICTAEMKREGGYEPQWCYGTPAIEERYKTALRQLLKGLGA